MIRTNRLNRVCLASLVAALVACGGGGGSDVGDVTPPGAGTPGGGTPGGGTPGGGTPGVGGLGDQYGSGPDPTAAPSGNPTSTDLIDAALAAGDLSTEQALTYKMFADFGDARLPAQYVGDDVGHTEGDAHRQALAHIASVGVGGVAAATLDALRPFFVPAYYAGSWWHQQNPNATAQAAAGLNRGKTTAGVRATAANPNCRPFEELCPLLAEWKKVEGTKVVVWYLGANEATDAAKAAMLVTEFDTTIWPKLTGLMGREPMSDAGTGLIAETDGRLDVLLVDMAAGHQGLTQSSGYNACKAGSAHIYLNRNLPNRGLIANAAHEFMHAIQFSINVKAPCLEAYYTIIEATAVWATNYVYPKNDWEHSYAKHYLTERWVSESYDYRPPETSLFRYGAYVLPLFLETRFGASIVKGIWDKTTEFNQELFAIDSAIDAAGSSFHKEWPKFIAANWNRDTIDTYFKADILVENVDLNGDDVLNLSAGTGSRGHPVELKHASAAYYRVVLGSSDARSITIVNGLSFKAESIDMSGWGNNLAFTGLSPLQRQGASMQVFLKVNGSWLSGPSNLSNAPWVTVCRDDPAGKIDEIIIMYGNAEISPSAPNYTALVPSGNNPGVLATNIGCRDWTGSLQMSRPLDGGSETLTVTGARLKNQLPTAAPTPGDGPPTYPLGSGEQIMPGFGWIYAFTEGNARWTYNESSGGCTSTASKSFSIANPGLPPFTNSGFTPPGNANHGAFFSGFLIGVAQTAANLSVNWRCVDSQGQVTTGISVEGTSLDVNVVIDDPVVRISTGTGLSVGGTSAQTHDSDATGTWSLQGETN